MIYSEHYGKTIKTNEKYSAIETVSNLQAAAGFSSISTILAKQYLRHAQTKEMLV